MIRVNKLYINTNNLNTGLIQVRATKSNKRYKLRLEKENQIITHDLNNKYNWETFALQFGNGEYKITLYEQVTGNRYISAGTTNIIIELKNLDSPFLYKNNYINYKVNLSSVAKSLREKNDDITFFNNVKNYIINNYKYDFLKAFTINKNNIAPEIDACFNSKKGICKDLAALTVAILREGKIPTKLAFGYYGDTYHAWVLVKINGEEILFDPTVELNAIQKNLKYTINSIY